MEELKYIDHLLRGDRYREVIGREMEGVIIEYRIATLDNELIIITTLKFRLISMYIYLSIYLSILR